MLKSPHSALASRNRMMDSTDESDGIPRWAMLWLVTLLITTVSIRVIDPTGWIGSDDTGYYSAADHILNGEPIQRVHHHYARAAIILPVACSISLLGHNTFAVILPSIIASTLCILLVAILGRLVWNWWVGLCGATLLSMLPYFLTLSSVAYPDVHACFWVTLSVVLIWKATQCTSRRNAFLLTLLCGFAVGVGVSAKIFSMIAVIPILGIIWTQKNSSNTNRFTWITVCCIGGLICLTLEGLFYSKVAGDFLFHLHALRSSQSNESTFQSVDAFTLTNWTSILWTRLSLPFRPAESGLGLIGYAFWPVMIAALIMHRNKRIIALWGIAVYLLIAFLPVSFQNGIHPYPHFHGRHILVAAIPFTLCTAWLVHTALRYTIRPAWIQKGWPVVMIIVFAFVYNTSQDVSGFRYRQTGRIGQAITQAIQNGTLDDSRDIFMTPSMYWRYRILFSQEQQACLHVAADENAPTWWLDVTSDMADRWEPLPPPGQAILIATPAQLMGEPEFFDYGVTLPLNELKFWQEATPVARYARLAKHTIGLSQQHTAPSKTVLLILTGDELEQASQIASAVRFGYE